MTGTMKREDLLRRLDALRRMTESNGCTMAEAALAGEKVTALIQEYSLLLMEIGGRETLTVPEAGQRLGIGRNQAYDAVKRGEIPVIRIGHRLLVPRAALDRLLNGDRLAPPTSAV